ncbi:hypothetical protein M758_UG180100 [Ceratodon purpureus]|nr:hypothetical protein M758_UG180100 [Ceratodon purpureus]
MIFIISCLILNKFLLIPTQFLFGRRVLHSHQLYRQFNIQYQFVAIKLSQFVAIEVQSLL